MILRVFSCALASSLLALGCGDDHLHSEADGGDSHSHDSCGLVENCKDTVELTEGLTVTSKQGSFVVKVLEHEPLSIEDNSFVLGIEDDSGAEVKDADVTQDVFSVDCMHGGPLPPQHIGANADGHYEVHPFHEHEGPWNTTLKITKGGVTDTATLSLCVPEGHHDEDAGAAHQD